jgi:hypothetical protein
MEYKTISPLGDRRGLGTFDTFWDTDKYNSLEIAVAENDYVQINFVLNENNIIYLEFFHSKDPEKKIYYRLEFQGFLPFLGIDTRDDNKAIQIALDLLVKYKK